MSRELDSETEEKNRQHLFLCRADEIEGDHERLIQFLVEAPSVACATRRARQHLRQEWCDEPDDPQQGEENIVASFFGGEIIIRHLEIRKVNHTEALSHFTRG